MVYNHNRDQVKSADGYLGLIRFLAWTELCTRRNVVQTVSSDLDFSSCVCANTSASHQETPRDLSGNISAR